MVLARAIECVLRAPPPPQVPPFHEASNPIVLTVGGRKVLPSSKAGETSLSTTSYPAHLQEPRAPPSTRRNDGRRTSDVGRPEL